LAQVLLIYASVPEVKTETYPSIVAETCEGARGIEKITIAKEIMGR
jgi:hypothetical protein